MAGIVSATRLRRIAGYLGSFAKNATPERLANLVQNEWEYRTGALRLSSFAPTITIDITNRCMLRCPLCATGRRETGRPAVTMDVADFEQIVREIADRSFQLFLYCWGDPLLVPHLADYIRIARHANLAVTLSSNLSMKLSDDAIDALVLSGPDRLIVSLDGTDAATYATYRIGGNFDRVRQNALRIAQARSRLQAKRPVLIWQFLAFAHNYRQLSAAESIYRAWGFDGFEVEKPNLPFGNRNREEASKWFAPDPALRVKGPPDLKDNLGNRCFWPWRAAVIQADGALSPCCYTAQPDTDVGNVIDQGFAGAWNDPRMVALRKTLTSTGNAEPCCTCRKE